MKIKCLRFHCEVCTRLTFIQVFYNKSGTVKYARARHYKGQLSGKPQFEYHQQSLEYVQKKFGEMFMGKTEMGQVGQRINDDPLKAESSTKLRTVAGPMGFEPMTFSLEG